MTIRRPRWAWLLFPHLSALIGASVLAACHRLPRLALDGGLDKLGHFLMFAALSLFAVGFFGAARRLRVVFVLGLLSALEEVSQAWFPARTLDALDLAANVLGVLLGAHAATHLARRTTGYAGAEIALRTRDKLAHAPISPDDDQPDTDRLPTRPRP
jgi:VanZ family protein